jgi:putative transposase
VKLKKPSLSERIKDHNLTCEIEAPHKQIKVMEFKLNLTTEQKNILDKWLGASKSVWNRALKQLELFENFSWYDKESKTYVTCCPVWEFRQYYLDDNDGITREKTENKLKAPYCNVDPTRREYQQPIIKNDTKFGLYEVIKGENIMDAPWIEEIPYKLRASIIEDLAVSWQEYKKSISGKATNGVFRSKPRYKGRLDTVKSIAHRNPKDSVFPDLDNKDILVGMPTPEFKQLAVRGLSRWKDALGRIPLIAVVRIIKKRNKYFLQLTGEFHSLKPKGIKFKSLDDQHTIGLDVGLKYHFASSDPTRDPVQPLRALRQSESKIKRTQRKIDKKRIKRLLIWLKTASLEDLRVFLPNAKSDRLLALLANTPKNANQLNKIVGNIPQGKLLTNLELQILKAKLPVDESGNCVSNKERKLLETLTGTHDKIARQRLAFNHKLSTFLVRSYAGIAVEKLNLVGLKRRAKVKKNNKGGYDRNNAKAKSGLNKSFADAGLGQFLQMLEAKCKDAGREFVKVNPAYTSQECSNCGTIVKKSLSQRTHECPECGYVEDRDVNAAINIKKRGFPKLNT